MECSSGERSIVGLDHIHDRGHQPRTTGSMVLRTEFTHLASLLDDVNLHG